MRGVELFGCAPDGLKRGVVEIQRIEPAKMFVGIDVGADLRATQAEFADATLQFARGEIRILQRNCRQPGEARRMRADDLGDVIVQPAGKIERVRRFRPIAEHHRHRRKHLHGNAGAIHSSMRRAGSQTLSVISRKTRSPIIIRAQHGW